MTAGSPTGLGRQGDIPSSRASGRLDGRLLVLAALIAAAAAAFILVLHACVFGQRLTFPLDLEWMEGGVLVHAYRIVFGWQSVHASRPTERTAPTARDRAAAAEFLSQLRALPGPVFVPSHPFYAVLAGYEPTPHIMGIHDTRASLGKPTWLAGGVEERKFGAVVLDGQPPSDWTWLRLHYSLLRQLEPGRNTVRMFTGEPSEPRLIFTRRR